MVTRFVINIRKSLTLQMDQSKPWCSECPLNIVLKRRFTPIKKESGLDTPENTKTKKKRTETAFFGGYSILPGFG